MSLPVHQIPNPPIELHVECYRPHLRFGLALHIYARTSVGQLWYGYVYGQDNDRGELGFVPVEPNTYPDRPTLYLTEELAEKMKVALNGQPIRTRGEETATHLKDAIAVRDRMISLVEYQTRRD